MFSSCRSSTLWGLGCSVWSPAKHCSSSGTCSTQYKALKWCSQFRRSSLFPQFYLSRKLTSGPSSQLEICGIGSAICNMN
ncbi:hypothetical protein PVAP13_6KG369406 [Panicum virgatum]|uniref:Uncharacterized protein n=1 Tax=Panicum virgatum TaxID=38727 RepID=A0A8T0RJB8_PANVG|nr:hypothetical protein PVAP13_6KG369406 [Panicum virgatum]